MFLLNSCVFPVWKKIVQTPHAFIKFIKFPVFSLSEKIVQIPRFY